jgi:hypothetical protein
MQDQHAQHSSKLNLMGHFMASCRTNFGLDGAPGMDFGSVAFGVSADMEAENTSKKSTVLHFLIEH